MSERNFSIEAASTSIRNLFSNKRVFVIPEFQRPYSWEKDECAQLWDDLKDDYLKTKDDEKKEHYFLGSVVIAPEQPQSDRMLVIDGQQRLITLALLMRVLCHRQSIRLLESRYRLPDSNEEDVTETPRVQSMVLDTDAKQIKSILNLAGEEIDSLGKETGKAINPKDKIFVAFKCLYDKLCDWEKEDKSLKNAEAWRPFVDYVLDRVVLLPIRCASEDEGLSIFETINDRGMQLTDADIFKARLYNKLATDDDKKDFKKKWDKLYDSQQTFRDYMYIKRAEAGETGKEQKLRKYYYEQIDTTINGKEAVHALMDDLLKIESITRWLKDRLWWQVLGLHVNKVYWRHPILVYLRKHGNMVKGEFEIDDKYVKGFDTLAMKTAKYFFFKSLIGQGFNYIKGATFKVSAAIATSKEDGYTDDYTVHYTEDAAEDEFSLLEERIGGKFVSGKNRYTKGVVVLAALDSKTPDNFPNLKGIQVEHILPSSWPDNYYDEWTEDTVAEAMDKLGNMMPLEKVRNIKASNKFFEEKKRTAYMGSQVADAQELAESTEKEWTHKMFDKRHEDMKNRLLKFFGEYKKG